MASSITRQACQAMDQNDPLAGFINRFQRSKKHSIFLDANSLGAMPATVPSVFEKFCLEEWTEERSQAWATRPWIARPTQIGAALAPLIGARPEDVLAGDSTTVNLFKLLSYAWRVRRSGSQILTDSGNFPPICMWQRGWRGRWPMHQSR